MKIEDAKRILKECRGEDGSFNEEELIDLILWAYDQGFEAGMIEGFNEQRARI